MLALVCLASALVLVGPLASSSGSPGPCDPVVNEIACENSLPGTPMSEWQVIHTGDATIQGFATSMSVNAGGTIQFKVKTDASDYTIQIYRFGYYNGDGARLIDTIAPSAALPQAQPDCLTDAVTGLVDCGNWAVSASWNVPADAVSGVYFARLERTDTEGNSMIVFVVRDDGSNSELLFQTSDTTWTAYNPYGGTSLYMNQAPWFTGGSGPRPTRAAKVSYNRPVLTRNVASSSWFMWAEFPMVRWLERNGYDVSYFSGVDTAVRGAELLEHEVFLSVGHDEYWSSEQRANVELARAGGVNLAFFSGNEVFWKTRWEPSIDAGQTPFRTVVSYKETLDHAKRDPSPTWTGTWRDPRFSPPSDGGRPENALTGTLYTVNSFRHDAMTVPATYGELRFWRNTDIATLAPGTVATLPAGVLGYEWDEDKDNGFRPPGLFNLSSTSIFISGRLLYDYGGGYGSGTARHSLNLYRAASGALVFGAGTVQWSWGLDGLHDTTSDPTPVDRNMQQATTNLFADMHVQPATRQADLVPAASSTDTSAPTATFTGPSPGASLPRNETTIVTGTATDTGGGAVGGVEVSTDGQATWHPASGRNSWSYPWEPTTYGPATISVRAVDDSGNIGAPTTITVETGACPCNIFKPGAAPAVAASGDNRAYELGVKFRSDVTGYVSGIRFYKGAGNTGSHLGHLWSASGTRLSEAIFSNETATGWQQALFPTPVPIQANTTYVASYFGPNGNFSLDRPFFTTGYDNAPLHALRDVTGNSNGVYSLGGGFPTTSFQASNYWVDVMFDSTGTDQLAPSVVGMTPAAGSLGIPTSADVTAQFDEPIDPASLTSANFQLSGPSGVVAASVVFDETTLTATLHPTALLEAGSTYTALVRGGSGGVRDLAGNPLSGDTTWTFRTMNVCPCSIWDGAPTPTTLAVSDGGAYELGVKFRTDVAGYITGIRFYKGPGNTGSHRGHLWTTNGTRLGEATFSSETASGWQQALFPVPIPVQAATTYIASYSDPSGHFSLNRPYFTTGYDNAPLRALRDVAGNTNGVYATGVNNFPSTSYGASNYWVDVVFDTTATDRQPPSLVGKSPAAGSRGIPTTTDVTAQFDEPIDPASLSAENFQLTGPSGIVPATVGYEGTTRTATLHPSAPLGPGSTYTALVRGGSGGVRDLAGNPLSSDTTWTFRTVNVCPCSIWDDAPTPATLTVNDNGAYELGVKFRADTSGYITGIRFYKGSGNTGTHRGHLWTTSGTRLGEVTFTGETAGGWQQALFASPIPIQASTTYVASYSDPVGRFSLDRPYFTSSYDNPPLHALANVTGNTNGVYATGVNNFPTTSYGASNYWVDVVFDSGGNDQQAPSVVGRSPAAGSREIPLSTEVTAQFDEPVDPASLTTQNFQLTGPSGIVSATVTGDQATRTATLHPSASLAAGTTYTALVRGGSGGVRDLAGNPLSSDSTWTFRTVNVCPCSIWDGAPTPTTLAVPDTGAYELGVKFRSDTAGYITGIRFYKGPGNTGTHRGHLWTATGTLLGEVVFSDETSTGWQQALFSSPIPIQADTNYVAGYSDPAGRFSLDRPYFTNGYDNTPLHALANVAGNTNGVYATGVNNFPTTSYGASNYWVDVVFASTLP